MTPTERLDAAPVHSISSAAIILNLLRRNGDPHRAAVHLLVRSGALRLVDPTQPIQRWTVSAAELRRYIAEGPYRLVAAPNADVPDVVELPRRAS